MLKKYKALLDNAEKEKIVQSYFKEGILALLHDRLYQACQYHMLEEFITVDELNNLKHIYENYLALGGNGTGKELYTRCKNLPIVTQKEIKKTLQTFREYAEDNNGT